MKYLGIDYGKKRIGVAISDSGGQFAAAYSIVENVAGAFEEIGAICQKEGVQAVVLGRSVDLEGKENEIQQHIDRFAELVQEKWNLPVFFVTEVFSSMQAKWGVTKHIRRGTKDTRQEEKLSSADAVDQGAAVIILQSFLDQQKR